MKIKKNKINSGENIAHDIDVMKAYLAGFRRQVYKLYLWGLFGQWIEPDDDVPFDFRLEWAVHLDDIPAWERTKEICERPRLSEDDMETRRDARVRESSTDGSFQTYAGQQVCLKCGRLHGMFSDHCPSRTIISLTKDDFKGGPWWLMRKDADDVYLVTTVADDGVHLYANEPTLVSFDTLGKNYYRAFGWDISKESGWRPCFKCSHT